MVTPVTAKIQLPANLSIHDNINIGRLKKHEGPIPKKRKIISDIEKEEYYEVEKIIEQKGTNFLVKWKGYPEGGNSWVSIHDLQASSLLKKFWDRNRK